MLSVALFLTGGLSYCLWLDLQEDAAIGKGGKPVASIKSLSGSAKRRPGDRFRWFRVGRNRRVFPGDSVSTEEGARLLLEFNSGTSIEIGENSLLTIEETSKGGPVVRLKSGKYGFHSPAGKGPGMTLEASGTRLDVGLASGTVALKDGVVSLNVQGGRVNLGEGARILEVRQGKLAQFAEEGVVQLSDSAFRLIEPEAGRLFRNAGEGAGTDVSFAWEAARASPAARLEIASEPRFGKVWQSIPIGSSRRANVALPTGRYYWRIRSSPSSFSEVRSFEILDSQPIELLQPGADAFVSRSPGEAEVFFSWQGREGLKGYVLQISDDAAFGSVLLSKPVGETTRAFAALPRTGALYWRVEAAGGFRSAQRRFVASPVLPAEPLGVSGKNLAKAPFLIRAPAEQDRILLVADLRGRLRPQPVRFSVECPDPSGSAEIRLRKLVVGRGGGGGEVSRKSVPLKPKRSSDWVWEPQEAGEYEWTAESPRCRSVSRFKVERALESIAPPEIRVVGQRRANNRLGSATRISREPVLKISWDPVKGVKDYKVVFGKRSAFDPVALERQIQGDSAVVKSEDFPFTPVYYRVEGKTQDGQRVVSPTSHFRFEFLPPILVEPRRGAGFSVGELRKKRFGQVIFSWEHTQFTRNYEIEVARDPGFRRILLRRKVMDNFFIGKGLKPGTYWWHVTSECEAMRSQASPPRKLLLSP